MKCVSLPALFLFALLLTNACKREFTATVVSVTDGDTFVVAEGTDQKKIRLFGIDCPEDTQAFGAEAREFTSAQLEFAKTVRVQPVDLDIHGRIVANVYLPDGRYLNGEILSAGYGWWFRKYAPRDRLLEKLEREAKQSKRGLWRDLNNPIEPWNFREQSRTGANLEGRSTTRGGAIEIIFLHCNGSGEKEPDEYVEIQNKTTSVAEMGSWILHDEGLNNSLKFPSGFRIRPGETCKIYTNLDTGCLSFHRTRSAVWNNNGDRAYLKDSNDQLIAARACDD